MKYSDIYYGTFVSRPNRFIAHILINNELTVCHVKNTGRCRELLVSGARVILEKAPEGANRKTAFDLVSVYKGERLVNMDSQAPNKIFAEWIKNQPEVEFVKPEVTFGNSRFDFYIEKGGRAEFAEIKGVTLEKDNIALFPDASTERGIKHLKELQRAVTEGYDASVYFIIQMKGTKKFSPSRSHHSEFCDALKEAAENGVKIYALECEVFPEEVSAVGFVPVDLEV